MFASGLPSSAFKNSARPRSPRLRTETNAIRRSSGSDEFSAAARVSW